MDVIILDMGDKPEGESSLKGFLLDFGLNELNKNFIVILN